MVRHAFVKSLAARVGVAAAIVLCAVEDVGVITSLELVPEPNAALVGAACVASLGGIARRRRVAAAAC